MERCARSRNCCGIISGFVMQGVGIVVPIFATYDTAAGTRAALFLRCDGGAIRGGGLRGQRVGIAGGAQHSVLCEHVGRKPLRKIGPGGGGGAGFARAGYRRGNGYGDGRRGPARDGSIPVVKIVSGAGHRDASEEELANNLQDGGADDRGAVPMGRGDLQSPGIHRASARGREPDRGAEL